MMKMAEALSQLVGDFRLVTQCTWQALFKKPFDYFEWYGIQRPFKIVRLPTLPPQTGPIIESESTEFPRFIRWAAVYARLSRIQFVYTRQARAANLCTRLGLVVIFETHMEPGHAYLPYFFAVKDSSKLIGVVTISQRLKDFYLEQGVPEEKVLVAPSAANPEQFKLNLTAAALRKELELPLEGPMVVYCGHLYPNRGVEEMLEAARRLPEVHFVLVGGTPEDTAFWREQTCGEPNIRLTGFVPNQQVPLYLCAGDALLMPYSARVHTAGWMSPLKLFDYMAAGRPIIASDLPVFRTILEHGRNAWLVEPDSGEALATGIQQVLHDPELAARLAEQAAQDIRQYTWEKRARTILERFAPEALLD